MLPEHVQNFAILDRQRWSGSPRTVSNSPFAILIRPDSPRSGDRCSFHCFTAERCSKMVLAPMVHLSRRDRSTVLTDGPDLPGTHSTSHEMPVSQLSVLDTLVHTLTRRRPFAAVIGGMKSEAARVIDEALGHLPEPVYVARAAARREAPLTLAMLIERILPREPGSLHGDNVGSALKAIMRGGAGAPVRRILVIDEADHAPQDVLGYLALLTTLLGSNASPLTTVLIGPPGFLQRCPPAIARRIEGEDVVDLRSFPDFSTSLFERAFAHTAAPSGSEGLDVGRDGRWPRARPSLALLGIALLLAAAVAAWSDYTRMHIEPLGQIAAASPDAPASAAAPETGRERAALPPAPARGDTPQEGPASRQPAAAVEPALSPALLAALMRRGNAAFAEGDITAARLLFERAAGTSAVAATAEGKTYDPNVLSQVRARGIQPHRNAAEFWYRRAIEMGDPQAADLLERLRAVPHG